MVFVHTVEKPQRHNAIITEKQIAGAEPWKDNTQIQPSSALQKQTETNEAFNEADVYRRGPDVSPGADNTSR